MTGRVKRKVLPWPGRDSTQIRPPCRSTTLLQIASPIPVPGYLSRPCSRWKIWKIRSPVLRRDADAVVAHREDPLLTGPLGRDVDARRAVAELQRVADQVLEELDELGRVGEHRGQVIMGHHRPLLLDGPAEIGHRLIKRRPGPHLLEASRLGGDAGIAEQAVDQGLHPRRRRPRS